ncbi:MAG: 2-oxoglutarate oxidoreductase [Candidatus Omnitrophica bacterium]|nr:2-oxoglutarate oxidoreductase [Candidatus Omnitrophota bacterium]
MKKIYSHPESLRKVKTHYCPGCGHGLIHKLICQVIDELGIRDKTIAVAPVGCAVIAYDYWKLDTAEAAHGRATAVATGLKRTQPEKVVFTYQGDGDLAAIGTAETIHTANRGENITVIFVNNAVYGMTGGQMAPTTLLGQRTATTPLGRNLSSGEGPPLKLLEMLAQLSQVSYLERTAITTVRSIHNVKRAIKNAFSNQLENKGFGLVEILSPCPTYWGKTPLESLRWIEEEIVKVYPLGRIK